MTTLSSLLNKSKVSVAVLSVFTFLTPPPASAADPSPSQALALRPIQKDVEFDSPPKDDIEKCKVESIKSDNGIGWYVRDRDGQTLRTFLDTNRDGKIDRWCYFQDGVEVYRDIDENFNGRADQYRWLGTAGTRWGIDTNEDGRIESWKVISAEEVTAEVIAAVRDKDADRFKRLLLTDADSATIGMGKSRREQLSQRVSKAVSSFPDWVKSQSIITSDSKWVHFGGSRPGIIPQGTDNSTKDIVVYDNVAAVVERGGKHEQLAVGTLIETPRGWRIIDLPQAVQAGAASSVGGLFFQASLASYAPTESGLGQQGIDDRSMQLLSKFEEIEKRLATASNPAQLASMNEERAQILEQLVDVASNEEERSNWIRQFADTISGAYQSEQFPAGLERLKKFHERMASQNASKEAMAYIHYRFLNCKYTNDLQNGGSDFGKIQENWLSNLKSFVSAYPTSDDAADAMLQIAVAQEFAGLEKEAISWYAKIAKDFPGTPLARKAAGAQIRLTSVGKPINFEGQTVDGGRLSLRNYSGKVVLIHYWATWCEPCKAEFETLKNLQAKYGRNGFDLIGVSIDNQLPEVKQFLAANRLPWAQMHEQGGMESRLANELGVVTLPTMILVGKDGRVVRRNITAGELDTELNKLIR